MERHNCKQANPSGCTSSGTLLLHLGRLARLPRCAHSTPGRMLEGTTGMHGCQRPLRMQRLAHVRYRSYDGLHDITPMIQRQLHLAKWMTEHLDIDAAAATGLGVCRKPRRADKIGHYRENPSVYALFSVSCTSVEFEVALHAPVTHPSSQRSCDHGGEEGGCHALLTNV